MKKKDNKAKTTEATETKKGKKIVLITAVIVLVTILAAGFVYQHQQTKKSKDSKWGQYALLLIGCQTDFWTEDLIRNFPDFARNVHNLLAFCREEGIDIIYLRGQISPDVSKWPPFNRLKGRMPCVKGTGGDEVLDFAKDEPGDLIVFKKSFDGF